MVVFNTQNRWVSGRCAPSILNSGLWEKSKKPSNSDLESTSTVPTERPPLAD
jgi:hypothetical protein